VTIKASTTADQETITAATGGKSGTATLTETAPASVAVALTPASIPADGTSTSSAKATVKDASQAAVAGAVVAFTTSGDATFPSGASCTTAADGTCSVTIKASTTADSETITASTGGKSGTAVLTETPKPPPSTTAKIVTAPGPGGGPHIKVWNAGGTTIAQQWMDGSETAGKHVASGDVNGDGKKEVITGSGPNSAAVVSVYDAATGHLIASSFAYSNGSFYGGVFVAAGDVDGDGKAEVLTAAGPGGGPHVKIWKVVNGQLQEVGGFFAYGAEFHGGVTIASGDVNGDGKDDIITGPGAGGGPHVRAWSGANNAELFGFMAYTNPQNQANWTGGVNVAAGDIDGDGKAEIAVGPWSGGGPHVRTFTNTGALRNGGIFVGPSTFSGGITVALGDLNGDGKAELIAGTMTQATTVRVYTGDLVATNVVFDAYPGFGGGVFVTQGLT
jgi:hypothetical protein